MGVGSVLTSFMLWPSSTEPMGWCLSSWGLEDESTTLQPCYRGHSTCCSLHQAVCTSPCYELAWMSFWLQKQHLLAAFFTSKESSLPSLRSKCRLHRVQRVESTVFTKQVPPSSSPKSQVYRLYEASAAFIASKESSLPSL